MNKYITALRGYARVGNFPLDASSIFGNIEDAEEYILTDSSAYAGQIISIVNIDTREVISYRVGFGESTLELQELVSGDSEQLNKILTSINEILAFMNLFIITDNDITISEKTLKASTIKVSQISEGDDVVTVDYLDAAIESSFAGMERTILIPMDFNGGGAGSFSLTSFFSSISITVTESYDQPIALYFGDTKILSSDYIKETIDPGEDVSVTIFNLNKAYNLTGQIRITPDAICTTGSGKIKVTYIEI